MSQYANIYLRYKDNFIPIDNISRSNHILYPLLNEYFPYGKLRPMSINKLTSIRSELVNSRDTIKNNLEDQEKKIAIIQGCNNSIDDKMIAINDILSYKEDYETDLEDINYWLNFLDFLRTLIDSYHYDGENEISDEMRDKYIWCGIEASPNDIEED